MPTELHRRLREHARQTGQSLNQLCIARLQVPEMSAASPVKAIPHDDPITPDLVAEVIRRWHEDLIGLVLFGSTARGEATRDSDVDILLAMKPELKISRALYQQWEEFSQDHASGQAADRISPHFVKLPGSFKEAGGLWYEVALDGIILWEQGHRVSRFLGSVRQAMGHGRIRRRILHGSPYWIREF